VAFPYAESQPVQLVGPGSGRGAENQQRDEKHWAVLVGNTFPPSLIRRRVVIDPLPLEELRRALQDARVVSFWGHATTVRAASLLVGTDLTPAQERPALALSPEKLPTFAAEVFKECWVVSPDFAHGYRPAVGGEVPPTARATSWRQCRKWHRRCRAEQQRCEDAKLKSFPGQAG
jgi:hypothetical protein